MQQFVYKVCARSEWDEAGRTGAYAGSADDLRDGFIHLSTASQLSVTLEKFFQGRPDQVLISFDESTLGSALRWEPSRGGQLFPHLYGSLPVSKALSVVVLAIGADGRHVLPKDLA